MQADFILFIRSHIGDGKWPWWPETLLYADRHAGAFEIFARSRSAAHFDRVKLLLGVKTKEELRPLLEAFSTKPDLLRRWEFESFGPTDLSGFKDLATRP